MDRLVGDARAHALVHHRVHHGLALHASLGERQQHGEHVPAMARIVARRQALGREELVVREDLEVEVGEAFAGTAPFVQVRQLLEAQARGHVGEVVLGAGVLHVARAVGHALDAVEAQLVHDGALALVVAARGRRPRSWSCSCWDGS